jgi:histidinol phosphatase-like enzyme (inositol monophosphatase family)
MSDISKNLQFELIRTAHALADVARPIALRSFRAADMKLQNKAAAGFDPVTLADRQIEVAMREILAQHRPGDGVVGEEFGPVTGNTGLTWVLDPIDGTRGFISGTPTWGVLIGLDAGAGPVLGLIDQPYTGERFFGGFGRASLTRQGRETPLLTRRCGDLADAILFTTFPQVGTDSEREAFRAVSAQVRLTRYGMDCYAYALVAAGQVDLVIEAGLNAYDIQGPMAVVQQAGGIVTSWKGGPAQAGGQVIAAGDARVHAQALALLSALG